MQFFHVFLVLFICVFIKLSFCLTNFDLTQLDFIHVSAGTSSVPIRNLIITFEKESEPLDNTSIKNAKPDCLDLLPDSLCDTSTIPSINQSVSHSSKYFCMSHLEYLLQW